MRLSAFMTRTLTQTSFARQPLDLIFAKPIAVRVIRALSRHGGALAATRIAREARITPNAARSGLHDLVSQSLVEELGSGRSRLYQIDRENPIVPALKVLFDAEAGRFEDALRLVGEMAGHAPQIIALWLFGSVARWFDTVDSDMDLAVVVDGTDEQVSSVADELRERVAGPLGRMGYRPSVVSMSLPDVWRMKLEGHSLWSDIVRESRQITGHTPTEALDQARDRCARNNGLAA